MKIKTLLLSLFVAAGSAVSARAAAAGSPAPDRQKMIEMHEKMADLHKQAAECLKSGKPIKECQDALAAQCPMAKGGCPMMGKDCPMGRGGRGMRGRGRGMGRGMGPGATQNAPAQAPANPADEKKP